jgi:serine/threonine protein kinase
MELLGSGGFGEVYKCFDLDTNHVVALKDNKVNAGKSPEDTE